MKIKTNFETTMIIGLGIAISFEDVLKYKEIKIAFILPFMYFEIIIWKDKENYGM